MKSDRRNAAWSMDRCNRKFPFLCQVEGDYAPLCNSGWIWSGGYCWKTPEQKLNFRDAFDFCHRVESGSKLAETTTPTEAKAVYDVVMTSYIPIDEPVWLSLCYNDEQDDWIWEFGEINTDHFSSWSYGEPTLKGETDNCVTAALDTTNENILWTAETTESENYFICQAEEGLVCPDGWTKHDGHCYEFFVGGHYWRSWTGAHQLCTEIGADLVSL